jgi:hypothetical protein
MTSKAFDVVSTRESGGQDMYTTWTYRRIEPMRETGWVRAFRRRQASPIWRLVDATMTSYDDAMHELELRISDVDRDRAAAALNTAVSEGRLTWPEHEERLARVYAARTGAELAPLLADLPQGVQAVLPAFAPAGIAATPPAKVFLSKVRRRPSPTDGPQQVDVTLGAAVIDLRDLPHGSVIDVIANSTLGKVEIFVSPGTNLIDTGTAWLGKRSTVEGRRGNPIRNGSPVVRLGGHSVLGHVRVTIG